VCRSSGSLDAGCAYVGRYVAYQISADRPEVREDQRVGPEGCTSETLCSIRDLLILTRVSYECPDLRQ
jgi:hypothetical protein